MVSVIGGPPDKPTSSWSPLRERVTGLECWRAGADGQRNAGGRGGGKDDIAQGGGTDGSRADDALKAVEYAIGHKLQTRVEPDAAGVRMAVDWGEVRIGVAACDRTRSWLIPSAPWVPAKPTLPNWLRWPQITRWWRSSSGYHVR